VFHFKNRIETLEKKSFMITEMYDSLLKEFGIIKSFVHSPQNRQNIILSTPPPAEPSPYKKIVVLDKVEEDHEIEDESEDDHDSEVYSQSSDSKSSNSDFESESDEISHVDLEEADITDLTLDAEPELEELEQKIETTDLEEDDDYESEDDAEIDDLKPDIKPELKDIKIESEELEPEPEQKIETIDLEESVAPILKPDTNYQKMNVQSLKMLVISKGLAADTSKMKRAELLKLLEDGPNF
jgi:hypothetical protein